MNESRQLVPESATRLPMRRGTTLVERSDKLDLGETVGFFRRQRMPATAAIINGDCG